MYAFVHSKRLPKAWALHAAGSFALTFVCMDDLVCVYLVELKVGQPCERKKAMKEKEISLLSLLPSSPSSLFPLGFEIANMDIFDNEPLVQLRYSISEASSYSGAYAPQNILYDRPHDMKSRWTGAAVANMVAPTTGPGGGTSTPSPLSVSTTPDVSAPNFITSRDGGNSLGRGTPGGHSTGTNTAVNSPAILSTSGKGTIPTATTSNTPVGGGSTEKQYLILKLDKPAILKKIHFGKYHKAHPCNLKDFKVYGSASTRDPKSKAWVRLVRGGLKNDAVPESFETRFTTAEGVLFPVRYIKVVPLATHFPNFNFSIWYIALEGIANPRTVGQVSTTYHEHRESVALRLILKHLRSRAYHTAFRVLLESCNLDGINAPSNGPKRPFERPIVTQLFHALMQGSWDVAEACLERAAWGDQSGQSSMESSTDSDDLTGRPSPEGSTHMNAAASLLSAYIERSVPKPVWRQILSTDLNGETPCGRGGHQMELDSEKGILWLFGGWDGGKDLADLWAYHIRESRWRCVSRDVRRQGGPSPRSCHKMVFDPRTGFLYVLGRYIDYDKSLHIPGASPNSSQTATNTPDNNSLARGVFLPRFPGGPSLTESTSPRADVEDGQNELFTSNRGGHMRIAHGVSRAGAGASPDGRQMAGLMPGEIQAFVEDRQLQTKKGYESDFFRFSTRTERWDRLSSNTYVEGGPKLIFDHQMLIDPETQMIYVFGGRVAHPDVSKVEMSGMWQYDVIQRSWTFLFDDTSVPHARIPSRVGHTMLLDTPKSGSMAGKRVLWILAGQRGTTYLADMWTYQISSGTIREISRDYSLAANGGGPEGGFTQRATIDSDRREIYLFSGLVRRSKNKSERVKSAFWVYNIERNEWKLLYQHGGIGRNSRLGIPEEGEGDTFNNGDGEEEQQSEPIEPGRGPTQAFPIIRTDDSSTGGGEDAGFNGTGRGNPLPEMEMAMPPAGESVQTNVIGSPYPGNASGINQNSLPTSSEPRPRFAAQMVYDNKNRNFYIFGGNPAESTSPSIRLDDLWCLDLVRTSISEILRKAKFKLRQQRFLEMAQEADQIDGGNGGLSGLGAMQALMYLQSHVSQVVNHDVPEESQAFRKLMAHLLHSGNGDGNKSGTSSNRTQESSFFAPSALFNDGSSPWMSPIPGAGSAAAESSGTFGQFHSEEQSGIQSLSVPSSGDGGGGNLNNSGEVQSDSEGGDSDMLSISQVLPQSPSGEQEKGSSSIGCKDNSSTSAPQLASEGQPSILYRQRYNLFRSLCQFFPPECVEPSLDLLDCVEATKLSF